MSEYHLMSYVICAEYSDKLGKSKETGYELWKEIKVNNIITPLDGFYRHYYRRGRHASNDLPGLNGVEFSNLPIT